MISTPSFFTLAKISLPSGPGTSFSLAKPRFATQNSRHGSTASTISTGASVCMVGVAAVIIWPLSVEVDGASINDTRGAVKPEFNRLSSMPKATAVTLADLVVLSLLCEGPRHGYELWAELERRQVEKWASISKPQVYYSL